LVGSFEGTEVSEGGVITGEGGDLVSLTRGMLEKGFMDNVIPEGGLSDFSFLPVRAGKEGGSV